MHGLQTGWTKSKRSEIVFEVTVAGDFALDSNSVEQCDSAPCDP